MSTPLDFDVLYCADTEAMKADDFDASKYRGLTETTREVFGGEWLLPRDPDGIHTMMNFVMSRDAKISFAEPGFESSFEINMGLREDLFLMGLARARADAVMIGDSTLRVEPQYWGTAEHIFPAHKDLYQEQREADGCREVPLQMIITEYGELPTDCDVLNGAGEGDLEVLIVTGEYGEAAARESVKPGGKADVLVCGDRLVDFHRLYEILRNDYGIKSIACEGGPFVYGSMLRAGVVDEHLTCVSPLLVGHDAEHRRPSLVEGFAYMPRESPAATLGAVRRSGDFLFLNWRG